MRLFCRFIVIVLLSNHLQHTRFLWATRILISDNSRISLLLHDGFLFSCSPFPFSVIEERLFLFVFNDDEHKKNLHSSGLYFSFHVSSSHSARSPRTRKKRHRVKVQRTRKLIAFLRSSPQLVTPLAEAYNMRSDKHTRMHTHRMSRPVLRFFFSRRCCRWNIIKKKFNDV